MSLRGVRAPGATPSTPTRPSTPAGYDPWAFPPPQQQLLQRAPSSSSLGGCEAPPPQLALSRAPSSSALSAADAQQQQQQHALPGAPQPPQPPHRYGPAAYLLVGAILLLAALAMNFSLMCRAPPDALVAAATRGLRAPAPTPAPAPPADTIHVALTACGNPSPLEPEYFGLLALKSLLMARAQSPAARNQSYAFHVVTDVTEEELFGAYKVNFDVQRLVAAEPRLLSLHLYQASALEAAPGGLGLPHAASLPHTIFKNCAAARLKLPLFLPQHVPRVLYLDWDVAVLSDLTELWREFGALEAASPAACLGMALNDPTGLSSKNSYQPGSALPYPAVGGVNSGVMLWQLARIRARGVGEWWGALLAVVAARVDLASAEYWSLTRAFPLGDQDILNALLAPGAQPRWLHVLPPRYNCCLVDALPPERVDGAGYQRALPGIIHFCGSRLTQETMREDGAAVSAQDRATKALHDYLKDYLVLDAKMPARL